MKESIRGELMGSIWSRGTLWLEAGTQRSIDEACGCTMPKIVAAVEFVAHGH